MGSRNTEQFDSELTDLIAEQVKCSSDFINMAINVFSNPIKKNALRSAVGIVGVDTLDRIIKVTRKINEAKSEMISKKEKTNA